MTYLGHIISSEGVEVDPWKTEVVKNWPRPLTLTDNRSFMSLTRYYRRFVEGLRPLHLLLLLLPKCLRNFSSRRHVREVFKWLKIGLLPLRFDLTRG